MTVGVVDPGEKAEASSLLVAAAVGDAFGSIGEDSVWGACECALDGGVSVASGWRFSDSAG